MHQVTAAPSSLGDLGELQLGCLVTIRTILGVFSPGHEEKIPTLETFASALWDTGVEEDAGIGHCIKLQRLPLLREVTCKERRSGIFSIEWHKLLPSSFASSTMPTASSALLDFWAPVSLCSAHGGKYRDISVIYRRYIVYREGSTRYFVKKNRRGDISVNIVKISAIYRQNIGDI